jgi:hypothetical protein
MASDPERLAAAWRALAKEPEVLGLVADEMRRADTE